ncbi:MAG: NAD-dependent DNA ligase LigA, partial [Nannocystaceae bacterium]
MAGLTSIELLALDAPQIAARLDTFTESDLDILIGRANREYWVDHAPSLPDLLYDQLVERLRELDPEAPILQELGEPSPTGTERTTEESTAVEPAVRFGDPVQHQRAMRSLDKCYDDEHLAKWAAEFEGDVLAMPKMDGVALSIHYSADGALRVAATRGDGRIGEDVTKNILRIDDIPRHVDTQGEAIEVRGEVYMRLSTFQQFAEDYANPRNLTAGTLKQKDGDPARCKHLSFFAYDLLGPTYHDEREKFDALSTLGFQHEGHAIDFIARDELAQNFATFHEQRASLDYEIDGVVYRVSLEREQRRLGETAHHPKWAIAYKFQGESGHTVLDDVIWSVSRTGTITPVALLTPIVLSGASIGRASLHNLSRFRELQLSPDCTVEVTRRGGVIPMLERVVARVDDATNFAVPTACPACGGEVVVRSEREAEFLMCAAPGQCQQARMSSLEHFAKVADIQGFGPKVIEQCIERGLLSEPADFYSLKHEQLRTLERLGDKSAKNLIDAIATRATLDLPTFLQSLGINHLGRQYAELLADRFVHLDEVL